MQFGIVHLLCLDHACCRLLSLLMLYCRARGRVVVYNIIISCIMTRIDSSTSCLVSIIIIIMNIRDGSIVFAACRILDEPIDDVVLRRVHDERKDKHDEQYLQRLRALGPAQHPIADPRDPGQNLKDEEDAELHQKQAAEVDDALFEPP